MAQMPIYITPQGHEKVRAEFNWLWREERPRVTSEVEAAAALGDRSENAEYQYGKRRLREIDRRLLFLRDRLGSMKVITPEMQARAGDKVGFGAWVVLEEDEADAAVTYRVVGPDEFDPDAGLISMDSPIGRAVLSKDVGDIVEVKRPKGTAFFTIVSVHYGDRPDLGA